MTFPCIILGERFDAHADLAAALTRIGVSGSVGPGQVLPSDRYYRCEPEERMLVGRAASTLLADAMHPGLLLFLAQIGPFDRAAWFPALLDRLEHGPAIPEHVGTGDQTVLDELTATFRRGRHDDMTLQRARAILPMLSSTGPWLQFLSRYGSGMELVAAIEDTLRSAQHTPSILRLAMGRLADQTPDQLMVVAPALAALAADERAALLEYVEAYAPTWWCQHGAVFADAVGAT
ncbi:MAG: hypothetical protein ACON4N_04530 [Myxococcota bacterium]